MTDTINAHNNHRLRDEDGEFAKSIALGVSHTIYANHPDLPMEPWEIGESLLHPEGVMPDSENPEGVRPLSDLLVVLGEYLVTRDGCYHGGNCFASVSAARDALLMLR